MVSVKESTRVCPFLLPGKITKYRIFMMLAQHAEDSREVLSELLRITAFAGHTNNVEYLLARGAQINVRDINGRTALRYAVHRGHEEACSILLKRGAAIGIEDDNGLTPIELALHCGR